MLLRYVRLMEWASVCRLFVTFVHPARGVELFANVLASHDSSGTWQIVLKFLEKIEGVLSDRAS